MILSMSAASKRDGSAHPRIVGVQREGTVMIMLRLIQVFLFHMNLAEDSETLHVVLVERQSLFRILDSLGVELVRLLRITAKNRLSQRAGLPRVSLCIIRVDFDSLVEDLQGLGVRLLGAVVMKDLAA